jgi:protein TonB
MGIEKKDRFIKTPEYPGGTKGIQDFIKQNLKYPKEAFDNNFESSVHVKYAIDTDGKVIEAKTVGSAGYGLEEEALRVVKLLKYLPAKNRKLRVTFNKKIDIHFRLPKIQEQEAKNMSVNEMTNFIIEYTVSPSMAETKKEDAKEAPKTNFGYQINFS